jgi:hypothetical protein
VTLVWAVPAGARALEAAAGDLAAEVAELRRLRSPLAEVRRATADTDARVEEFRAAHPLDPGGSGA